MRKNELLGYYIKSTIVFLIIYFFSKRIIKTLIHNRDEIDYKKYTKKDSKGIWYAFCFIPILRGIVLLGMFWIATAPKKSLDKVFQKKEN